MGERKRAGLRDYLAQSKIQVKLKTNFSRFVIVLESLKIRFKVNKILHITQIKSN